MIHAVAEGLALSLDEGELPRPNAWRARVREGSVGQPCVGSYYKRPVCLCESVGIVVFFGCFFSAPSWRTSVSLPGKGTVVIWRPCAFTSTRG